GLFKWYIADLALFYLLAPLLFKLIKNLKSSVIATLISIVISSLSLVISNQAFASQIATNATYEMYFHTFFILHQLPIMLLGVVLYYLVKLIKNGDISWEKSLFILGLIGICAGGTFVVLNLNKKYACSSLIAGFAFAFLFLLCSKFTFWNKSLFKSLISIGKHSYGIYCFHQVLINCLVFISYDKNSLIQWIVGFICISVISYVVGIVAETVDMKIRKLFVISRS
ncbi:MAG: acyltransferase family protein, partial [Lachnospiraceae bacterium]